MNEGHEWPPPSFPGPLGRLSTSFTVTCHTPKSPGESGLASVAKAAWQCRPGPASRVPPEQGERKNEKDHGLIRKNEKGKEDEAPPGRTAQSLLTPLKQDGQTGGRLGRGHLLTCWELSPHVAPQGHITHSPS